MCLNEKIELLCKLAMPRLSSHEWDTERGARAIQLLGEGTKGAARRRCAAPKAQYWLKTGKKKKNPMKWVFFFLFQHRFSEASHEVG